MNPQKNDEVAEEDADLESYDTRVRENVQLVAASSLSATWEDPSTGKKLYNQVALESAVAFAHLASYRAGLNDTHPDMCTRQELDAAVAGAQKAYGGCTNCYGKGYASVNDRWRGHDTDTDIGTPGGYISGGDANAMKFCSCDRGKELERRIAALRGKQ